METVHRKPFGAALAGALGLALLIAALATVYPNRAFAGDASFEIAENTLRTIGEYSDVGDGPYTLTGPDADDFYISNVEDDGERVGDAGTVYNNRGFDFEDADDKTLEFTVTAAGGETQPVTVTVTDKNDSPTFNVDVFECPLREQSGAGVPCGHPNLSGGNAPADDDDGNELTYSLSGASPLAEYLDIDPATGRVTVSVAGSGKLDAEGGQSEFKVSIQVSDSKDIAGGADAEIDDRAVIRVIVTDVENEAPELTTQHVREKSESLHVVWSTTREKAAEYQVRYRVQGDTTWVPHATTGEGALQRDGAGRFYTVIGGLYAGTEYEFEYCIAAACDDEGVWFLGNTAFTDPEPNAPARIRSVSDPLTIAENVDPSNRDENVVGLVYSHPGDGDRKLNQQEMRYWLVGEGSQNFAVELRSTWNGVIRSTQPLDYETGPESYTLTLHVSDGRNATGGYDDSSDDSESITITVTDVIERPNAPVLRAAEIGPNSIQVAWDTPVAGDQTITGYRILYADGRTPFIPASGGNSFTIEGLDPNTLYTFRGLTVTSGSPLTWSEPGLELDVVTAPGTAGQTASESTPEPRSAKQTSSTPEPAKPTPEPTPAPTPEPTPAPKPEPTPAPTPEPTPAPTTEPTPAPTTEPTPAPTTEPTPAPAPEPATERPGEVENLSVTTGSRSMTISWDPPGNQSARNAASGYDVDYRFGGRWISVLINGKATSVTVPDLDPGKHRVRVMAKNEHGGSRWARVNAITIGG